MQTSELHPARPLVKDKQVQQSLAILRRSRELISLAIDAIERNDHYNSADIICNDSFPHGYTDYIRSLIEPANRTYALVQSGDRQEAIKQARDVVGYAAIYSAWVMLGCPRSKLRDLVEYYCATTKVPGHAD